MPGRRLHNVPGPNPGAGGPGNPALTWQPERHREGAPGQRRSPVDAAGKQGGQVGSKERLPVGEASGVWSGCEFCWELEAGVV